MVFDFFLKADFSQGKYGALQLCSRNDERLSGTIAGKKIKIKNISTGLYFAGT